MREKSPQSGGREPIGTRIEQRHHDAAVGDVEIDVTRGETLARGARFGSLAGYDAARFLSRDRRRSRQWQLMYTNAPAARVRAVLQPLPCIPGNRMLRVAPIVGPGEADLTRPHEAGEIVDVAVGLVVEQPATSQMTWLTPR